VGLITLKWWVFKHADASTHTVLASHDGDALISERAIGNAGGRIVVWTSSADAKWNNWPLASSFVPLVDETVFHLASSASSASRGRRLDAGQTLVWTNPADAPPSPIIGAQVTGPDGQIASAHIRGEGARAVVSYDDTSVPGLYALSLGSNRPNVYYGVGIDPRELDAATLADADYDWLKSEHFVRDAIQPDALGSVIGTSSHTVDLWRWLALAVLGLLVFETFMTWRMVRLQAANRIAASSAAQIAARWKEAGA
jgi:hypothetical protein